MSDISGTEMQHAEIVESLETIEGMAVEYERAAEKRGEMVNAANYGNLITAVQSLKQNIETEEEA